MNQPLVYSHAKEILYEDSVSSKSESDGDKDKKSSKSIFTD